MVGTQSQALELHWWKGWRASWVPPFLLVSFSPLPRETSTRTPAPRTGASAQVPHTSWLPPVQHQVDVHDPLW